MGMLILPESYSWDDDNTARVYGLHMLKLWVGARAATKEDIHAVDLDYPLCHTMTLLRISQEFVELVDDGISTDEERQLWDSDIDSEDDDDVDPDLRDEALGPDIYDGMDKAWPGSFYITS